MKRTIRNIVLYVRPVGSNAPFRPQVFRTYAQSAADARIHAYLYARGRYEVREGGGV